MLYMSVWKLRLLCNVDWMMALWRAARATSIQVPGTKFDLNNPDKYNRRDTYVDAGQRVRFVKVIMSQWSHTSISSLSAIAIILSKINRYDLKTGSSGMALLFIR